MTVKPIDFSRVDRVLVFMPGGIGNLVLLMPALTVLRRTLPGRRLILLTAENGVAGIIEHENLADHAVCLAAPGGPAAALRFVKSLRPGLAMAAAHVNPWKTGALFRWLGIPRRLGQTWHGYRLGYTHAAALTPNTHETDGALAILAAAGIHAAEAAPLPVLHPTSAEMVALDNFPGLHDCTPGSLIGLHAGSGRRQQFKRWPAERFAVLADALARKYGARVVFTGGPDETALVDGIIRRMSATAFNAAGILPIRQTAALIARCRIFVSNDSGLAHIAAALNTPLVALFGATNPARIGPRGLRVRIVRQTDEINDRPGWAARNIQRRAMEMIAVEDVLSAVDELKA